MVTQRTAGNVIAAICSLIMPGLGQLIQGRWALAGFMVVLSWLLWLVSLGWIIHIWASFEAGTWRAEPHQLRRT